MEESGRVISKMRGRPSEGVFLSLARLDELVTLPGAQVTVYFDVLALSMGMAESCNIELQVTDHILAARPRILERDVAAHSTLRLVGDHMEEGPSMQACC